MSSKKKDKILILPNGEEAKVLKENGKFFICEGRQFRKLDRTVRVELRERRKEETEDADDQQ